MPLLKFGIVRLATSAVVIGVGSLAGLFGYRFVRADLSAQVYRDRLETLSSEYAGLRERYNEAVAKQAVTELVVRDGKLSVRVRDPGGVVEEIPTPYRPEGEIYVDYVVASGRLLIRRVFDDLTPPSSGLVIDPALEWVDWSDPNIDRGQAVYRRLDEGRWVITVTGQGTLGLRRAGDADGPADLVTAPEVRDFAEAPELADAEVGEIGPGEVWKRLTGD